MEIKTLSFKDEATLAARYDDYLSEMAAFYDNPLDAGGHRHFEDLKAILSAGLARVGVKEGKPCAYALLGRESYLGERVELVLRAFWVLPEERRTGTGELFLSLLMHESPGRWEVKCALANERALAFWRRVLAPHEAREIVYSPAEIVFSFLVPLS